jgi:hypothetical protein
LPWSPADIDPFVVAPLDMLPDDVLPPVDMLPLVADWAKTPPAETTLIIAAMTAAFNTVFMTYLAFQRTALLRWVLHCRENS